MKHRTEYRSGLVWHEECQARSVVGGVLIKVFPDKALVVRWRAREGSELRLPDLEYSKTAVLNSLTSVDGQRGYGHAIDEFVDWYCSESRLALNRTVVLRYRTYPPLPFEIVFIQVESPEWSSSS